MKTAFNVGEFAFKARRGLPAVVVLAAALVGALAVPAAAADPPKSFKVERTADIDYCDIPNDPDRAQHRLDVFRPVGKDECSVVFFVHGGGWMIGDKDDVFGIYGYGTIAESIARRGVVVVLPNYRLSPKAKHPDHITDVARAFAWTHRNIAKYGGRPDQLFASGHSAGGHLVSLLATDETYLKAEGLSATDVKGVVSISGIYRVDAFDLRLSAMNEWLDASAEIHPFASVFGDDPEVLKQASPLTHVRPGLPPFLLVYGSLDYCPIKQTTRDFEAALEDNDCEVDVKKVLWRTHETVLVDLVHGVEPATADALIRFVERRTRGASKPDR